MIMSSKFSRQPRIQPLPPLCAKSPNPSEMWDKPFQFQYLQGYAAWREPGTPAEINISGIAQLIPDPINNRWVGRTSTGATYIELILVETKPNEEYSLRVNLFESHQLTESHTQHNIPLRSLHPFQTTDIDFTPGPGNVRVTASVMA